MNRPVFPFPPVIMLANTVQHAIGEDGGLMQLDMLRHTVCIDTIQYTVGWSEVSVY